MYAIDKRNGLRKGTLRAIGDQESGFRYDPGVPHYPTGFTVDGVQSSAQGPWGILGSTGDRPGFGVSPLSVLDSDTPAQKFTKNAEFAGAYAKARGIAAYGEGNKYAEQVNSRIDKGWGTTPVTQLAQAVNAPAPVMAAPVEIPQAAPMVAAAEPVVPYMEDPALMDRQVMSAAPAQQVAANPWDSFSVNMPRQMTASDLAYGGQARTQPNLQAFKAFRGRV